MTQVPPEAPQAPQAPQAPPQGPVGAAPNPGKGLSIAGMILGIVGLVTLCIPYLAFPCSIVGMILSVIGKGKSKAANAPTGMATAGIVLCGIALALDVLGAILIIVGFSVFSSAASDPNIFDNMRDMNNMLPMKPF